MTKYKQRGKQTVFRESMAARRFYHPVKEQGHQQGAIQWRERRSPVARIKAFGMYLPTWSFPPKPGPDGQAILSYQALDMGVR